MYVNIKLDYRVLQNPGLSLDPCAMQYQSWQATAPVMEFLMPPRSTFPIGEWSFCEGHRAGEVLKWSQPAPSGEGGSRGGQCFCRLCYVVI